MRIKGIKKIFIDLDGVVFDTIECICNIYNKDFKYYNDFKPVHGYEIETWNFTELNCASLETINSYFNQPRFFKQVKTMPWAKDIIRILAVDYNIIFISMGDYPNLIQKEKWVKENFPYSKFIGVNMKKHNNKAHINMNKAVFIDDSANNLYTSNAKYRICFGDKYEWNEHWDGERCMNWMDVKSFFDRKK